MKAANKAHIKVFIPILLSLCFIALFAGPVKAQEKGSKIVFKETTHDFGKVEEGAELMYEYKFTNGGNENLVILKVQASCGCTGASIGEKTEYKKDETGKIKVTFDTTGKVGEQLKTVVIQSNDRGNPSQALSFTCEVVAK